MSRTIAREVLYERGILEAVERAAEVNALLSAIAFAEDEVARDPTSRRTIMARGALLATALDDISRNAAMLAAIVPRSPPSTWRWNS